MEACFGIDIGGTNTVIGLVNKEGELLAEGQISTTALPELSGYLDALAQEMRRLCDQQPIELRGIGMGAPNGNYYQGTIEHAPNLLWREVIPLAVEMGSRFPSVPVYVTNDANAAALGELLYGAAVGLRRGLFLAGANPAAERAASPAAGPGSEKASTPPPCPPHSTGTPPWSISTSA